jgi:general secretion pathway protein F
VGIAVVTVLLAAVVPKVVEQFNHMQQVLPFTTRMLMSSSDGVRNYGPWVLFLVMLLGAVVQWQLRHPRQRLYWHQWLLRLPLLGRLILGANLARYVRTLSILNASSVPVLEAMNISATVLSNEHARQQFLLAVGRVREGGTLASALEQTRLLSPMMRHMITSGESSGDLDNMLSRAADIQEKNMVRQIALALSLFEPLLIISMASVVLFIILAILQPILQLNNLMA